MVRFLNFPNPTTIAKIWEPKVKLKIFIPIQFFDDLLKLCQNNRGKYTDLQFLWSIKSFSKAYATMEYELIGY